MKKQLVAKTATSRRGVDKRALIWMLKVMATIMQCKFTTDNNLNLIQQYHAAFINTIPALQLAWYKP